MITKIKSIIIGFAILIIIQFCANCIVKHLHIPFPSPLLGMLTLVVLLYFKIIPEALIKDICDLLLTNMTLFFVPLFVGIITYAHLIHENLVTLIVTVISTTFITMILTAIFVELIIKFTQRKSCDD